MKTNRFLTLGVAAIFLIAGENSSRAEDWTTNDGKVYKDVSIVKMEPDAVTILHSIGGAVVPMANLSADIQKKLGYDPAAAQAVAEAKALVLEAKQMAEAKLAAVASPADNPDTGPISAPVACTVTGTPGSTENLESANSLEHDPNDMHHSTMDDLVQASREMTAANDTNHSSVDGLVQASREMNGQNDSHHASMDSLVSH